MNPPSGRRAFVVVLDACGIGSLPDAADYGDAGTNTLKHLADAVGGLRLPTLEQLGLGSIVPLRGVAPAAEPAVHGRLHPLGPGKDSTTGHWELMGVAVSAPLPTYPDGFPRELVTELEAATGQTFIGNRPMNGIEAIETLGAEHLQTGAPILYTSADSVLQIAAHGDRLPLDRLYDVCERARAVMTGEHAVGRVIARPFEGEPGSFRRTDGRRDLSLAPPSASHLDALAERGVTVHGVGKVSQLFAGRGVDVEHKAPDNARALAATRALLDAGDAGFVFTNLVETDQVYGHRKDTEGFHRALQRIDAEVADWLPRLRDGDLLVLTADHGVDPAHAGTDHTREYAPLLAITGSAAAMPAERRHDGPLADVGATVVRWLTGNDAPGEIPGRSFLR